MRDFTVLKLKILVAETPKTFFASSAKNGLIYLPKFKRESFSKLEAFLEEGCLAASFRELFGCNFFILSFKKAIALALSL